MTGAPSLLPCYRGDSAAAKEVLSENRTQHSWNELRAKSLMATFINCICNNILWINNVVFSADLAVFCIQDTKMHPAQPSNKLWYFYSTQECIFATSFVI